MTIFALDSQRAGLFSFASPSKAFDGVEAQRRARGYQLGADAVMWRQFEYRVALSPGKNQVIEIIAHGTAVRTRGTSAV